MKQPIHAFVDYQRNQKTGGLQSLQSQMHYLEQLTQLTKPVLPPTENWQVVSFQQDILCIAAEHYAAMSQLRYLQTYYVKQLRNIPEFKTLKNLKVIVESKPLPKVVSHLPLPALDEPTRQALMEAATLIHDRELSQALQRLASKKWPKSELNVNIV